MIEKRKKDHVAIKEHHRRWEFYARGTPRGNRVCREIEQCVPNTRIPLCRITHVDTSDRSVYKCFAFWIVSVCYERPVSVWMTHTYTWREMRRVSWFGIGKRRKVTVNITYICEIIINGDVSPWFSMHMGDPTLRYREFAFFLYFPRDSHAWHYSTKRIDFEDQKVFLQLFPRILFGLIKIKNILFLILDNMKITQCRNISLLLGKYNRNIYIRNICKNKDHLFEIIFKNATHRMKKTNCVHNNAMLR